MGVWWRDYRQEECCFVIALLRYIVISLLPLSSYKIDIEITKSRNNTSTVLVCLKIYYLHSSVSLNINLILKVMNQFSFERLTVWQDSRALAKTIYLLTKEFPADEKFGLVSQLRRSVISVSSNIVEGSYRINNKDKINFMNIAFGSLMELLSQIIISKDLEYIKEEQYSELRSLIEKVSNKLASLSNYFKTTKPTTTKSQNNKITQ